MTLLLQKTGLARVAALLLTSLAALHALEVRSSAAPAPINSTELAKRMAELRQEMAPFLESRPKPLETRRRQDLCGEDWLSKFEIQRVSESPLAKPGKKSTDWGKVEIPDSPGWEAPDLDVSGWERTSVPEWRYDALERLYPASCILWYRKTFTAERPAANQRVFLVFEGVDWEAEVWLNGRKLGSHRVYFEPFRFDVTDELKEQNTLAVRVIDGPNFGEPAAFWSVFPVPPGTKQRYVRERDKSLAGLKNGDTHSGSGYGIHREVYLETTRTAVVFNLFVRGYPAKAEAVVQVETGVTGNPPAAMKVELLPENFDGAAFSRSVPFAVQDNRQTVVVPVPEARQWSPSTPWLYRCRVSLLDNEGRVVDGRDALFGHRSIEMVSELQPRTGLQPGTLLLDGHPLFLRGTSIQGLNALWFWGERDKLLEVLLLLKAANFNAVRSCQHVTFPEVREWMDRLGIMSQQDVGSRNNQPTKGHSAAAAAIARVCYNNPGVVLLSFANETEFNPTDRIKTALAVDPERLFVPISGRRTKQVPDGQHRHETHCFPDNKDAWDGVLAPELRARVLDSFHPYWGWYQYKADIAQLCRPQPPGRMLQAGEYGSEALDGYETMKDYPAQWGALPDKTADVLWGHVQVQKNDSRQIAGFRGRRPSNLGEYIEASQSFQYDQLAELTKAWRLSPRRVAAYFQFHFIDVLPANWPKSIVSHDLAPKRAYFAMAQANQPLVPLCDMLPGGKTMELWVANDLPQAYPGSVIRWTVGSGTSAASGEQKVDVPASDAVMAGVADLRNLPGDLTVAQVELVLESKDGDKIGSYRQEVYLAAWRREEASAEKPAEGGGAGGDKAMAAPHLAAAVQESAAGIKTGAKSYTSFEEMVADSKPALPPVRALTTGPAFHWFGYYDKFQTDPTDRYLLCMQVGFEHRLPKSGEPIKIGMIDLKDNNRWIELGESRAWSWQQGCMLQWRPGSKSEVVWNDREGDQFVCRVLDVNTRKLRTLPQAIGTLSPDGKTALCEDFSRVWNFRAGYGYAGVPDRYKDQPAPAEIGVWRMDMESGETLLLVSLDALAKIPYPKQLPTDKHYVNHLSWNPDGTRFLMFDRWIGHGMPTRVFTSDGNGADLRLLSASAASHYAWRDAEHVLIWDNGSYRLYKDDGSDAVKETLWEAPNGHQSYVPGTRNEWIVSDTYAAGGQDRTQHLYLFHVPTRRFYPVGRFVSPPEYKGEWRCDLHPRLSRDGSFVVIDSPHAGNGRQQYLIEMGARVKEGN